MKAPHLLRSRIAWATSLAACCAIALAACGGSSSSSSSGSSSNSSGEAASSGTLEIWLGGDLTQATPGSPFQKWVNLQAGRFEKENPGWKVQTTLLPFDNSQNAAKLQAAFGSHDVPDVMNLYAGQFTNTYAAALSNLTEDVEAEKGLFASIPENVWSLSCAEYNCEGGKGEIFGIPWNSGAYFLFYNKGLLAKAGIHAPPRTYEDLFSDCEKLSAKGIVPVSMGASDGYDTSNMFTSNLVSTLGEGDIEKLVSGEMPYDEPQVVEALEPILKLTESSSKCTTPDALGQEQLKGTAAFSAGEAAMTPYFGLQLAAFQKELGKNLGIARLPLSGSGPLLKVNNGYAGNPFDNWVIPSDAKNAEMAWKFVMTASDAEANKTSQEMMGLSPAIESVGKSLTDPDQKFAWTLSGNPAIANLDQVMPGNIANYLYKQLALGQLGKQSAAQTMESVQEFAESPVNQETP